MKKVKVGIEGVSPLLMHSPKNMLEPEEGIKSTGKKRDPMVEAEKSTYRMKSGELYLPAEAVKGTMINAAAYKKIGKFAAKPIIAAGIRVLPREIGLGTKKYDVDLRTVVIQRNRIVKARPMINKWKVDFEIEYDETLIGNDEILKAVLEEAGKRVGLLDFRPQKLGDFGMFKVTKWQQGK